MSRDLQVLLVDDTASIRFALRAVLELEPGLELVDEATNGKAGAQASVEKADIEALIGLLWSFEPHDE